MHKVLFYKDKNGNEPVAEYIAELAQRKDKDSRIKLGKIRDYIKILSEYGTQAGQPYIKHLDGEYGSLDLSVTEYFLSVGQTAAMCCYINL